ncbi:hypothetical protein [Curtobacterium herbarum]|uniref:FtsX-like permease family protein n=1 Tax=Curtobacterium herbarum TaxID=150122 RepID=A0ABN1ZBR0_9MICO|nr:hypothetical protein [Curtobacterium herbarum]MBM7473907.1 hypothetical protein [Curtobacterium herbarum]MCS6544765.1 hypothetical protein [Curtobacterium herbarum]
MRPDRSSRFVLVAMVFSAAVAIAFALLATLDRSEQTFPTAHTALVVLDVPADVDLPRLLRERAEQDRIDFYRVQSDPDQAGRRIVHAVVGNPAAFARVFHDGMYRGGVAEQPVALGQGNTSTRGVYFSTASSAQASAFVSELRSVGVDARVEPAGWWTAVVFTIGRPGIGLALGASIVAAVMLGRLCGRSAARRLGVAEVLGVRRVRSSEAARTLRCQIVVASTATAAGSAVALALVGSQLPAVLAIAACVYWAHAVLFLGAMATGWPRTAAARMRAGRSAWRPRGRTALATSVLRVAAVTSVALAAGPLVDRVALLDQYRLAGETRIGCSHCTQPLLSGTLHPDEIEAAAPAFARLFRAVDDGRSVLASHPVAPVAHSVVPDVGNTLVVNREYLDRVQPALPDPWPSRTSVGPGEWALVVPEDGPPRATVIAQWREWFAFQREIDPTIVEPRAPVVVEYAPRSVFTFGAATDEAPLFADAPVIAVVPAASELLSGDFLTAAASNGQLLLDVDDPEQVVRSAGLTDVVGSMHRWPAVSAAHRSALVRTALAEAIAAALVLAVIVMAASIRASALRWTDRTRVREATGLGIGLLRTHARTLVAEGGVLVASVAVAVGAALALGAPWVPALVAASVIAWATSIAVVRSVTRSAGHEGDPDAI